MASIDTALPTLVSIGLLLKYWHQVKDQQIILGFLFFAVTMGMFAQYWGITGLHLFTGGFVIWPVLVLLLGDRFPWPLAYQLTFIGTLIPDLYDAGTAADWQNGWFFDVGGAGFRPNSPRWTTPTSRCWMRPTAAPTPPARWLPTCADRPPRW